MSIIDKAKSFMGGHGVTVRHATIEGAEPATAALALTTGGLRGQFAVVSDKPCTILSRQTEMVTEIQHADGRAEQVVLGRQITPDPDVAPDPDATPAAAPTEGTAATVKYPYDLAAGFEVVDEFDLVFDGSIEAVLGQRVLLPGSDVRFFLRTRVDVKGSPFDPEAVDELPLRR
ncbi:MAG TPA: hypothetical protein VNO30_04825 [Kofleriaceae bacterium]|nr:hypothetical protein [Kofleriaceae bacterium]